MASLFNKIVAEAGIAAVLAEGVVRRACQRAGIEHPERMKRTQIPTLLPHLQVVLRTYLGPTKTAERSRAIERLMRTLSSGYHIIALDDPKLDDD